ncbi:MAG: isoprenyl transferase [Saprospiraceae bacterium]|nr:isoprenyl transferase [Candidatus Brachybacter algidus]
MSASDLLNSIDKSRLPQHVAVIMDGNGRWAKQHGKARVFGHTNGVNSVRQVSEAADELGIKYLTLYAFSTENWNRPKFEVEALMLLLVDTINKEIATMMKNNISLKAIGNLDGLPSASRKALEKGIEETSNNTGLSMVLALNYSGREEITTMVKKIAIAVKEEKLQLSEINDNLISTSLYTHDIPDPELLIRTSGEHRVSNFLLWQMAYTEFYFTPVMWPDFGKEQFYLAINDYQNRERRFGKTSEQVK